VSQGVFDGDALDGVEGQQLFQQVERQVRRLGKHGFHGDLLLEGQRADVFARPPRFDAIVIFHRRRAEYVEDQGQLVMVWVDFLMLVGWLLEREEGGVEGGLTIFAGK